MYRILPIFLFAIGFAVTTEIYYSSDVPIGGFQFSVEGCIVKNAYAGGAAPAGYMISMANTIILGFIFGITQDLMTQIDLLGAMALTKSVIGFGLGTLASYRNIWSVKSRMLFIFLMYFLHFLIFYFIKFNGVSISILISIQIVIIHTLLSYLILFIIEKSFFVHGITSE